MNTLDVGLQVFLTCKFLTALFTFLLFPMDPEFVVIQGLLLCET